MSRGLGDVYKRQFQVWSLGEMRKISEEGVRFASPVNGDKLFLTPEVSMQIQTVLNSDIVMQFDECTPYDAQGVLTTEAEARASMELSLRWATRCKAELARLENPNALFGIVQGGMFEHLRQESLDSLVELDLPGYAIGGVSVGEPKDEMLRIMAHTPHRLPANKPRYLMGVGTPEDLVQGVADGVDMFDCVMPTRNARNGTLFTRYGGYVRYVVGIVLTVRVGRYAIVALNRYLARQKLAEQQPDQVRRDELSYDTALARLAKGVCPGCERPVDLKNTEIDFCPHCGIGLFDHCGKCDARKSAFSKFCHACGTPAHTQGT